MARELTRTAEGISVYRATPPPWGGPALHQYGSWVPLPAAREATVIERLFPSISRCQVPLDLARCAAGAGRHAWQWPEEIDLDDLLAIRTGNGETLRTWFVGVVVDVDAGWDADDEHVTITCAGLAFRMKADTIVYGRYMETAGGDVAHFSGLPCDFNAGGRANMAASRETVDGAPRAVPYFTYDGDPDAEPWTLSDVLDYLAWRYNAGEDWIQNPDLPQSLLDRDEAVVTSAEGLSFLDAWAAACAEDGYETYESFDPDRNGTFGSRIRVVRVGEGDAVTLTRLGAGVGETEPLVDLSAMNVFASSVAHATAPAVTRPIVAGGRRLVEITVTLGQAWDPSRLDLGGADADPDHPEGQFLDRYCRGGSDFDSYADVGRLWDANPDGRYSAAPFSLPVADMADLAGETAGSWPLGPYPPLPTLTMFGTDAAGRTTRGAVAEITFDGGSNWHPLTGFQTLPDRLGLWINVANPARVWKNDPDAPPDADNNLFAQLVDDASKVAVRLTCTVAAPDRRIERPSRRATAGTLFETACWLDRGTFDQKRSVAATSIFSGSGLAQDTVSGGEAIAALAEAVQEARDGREIEASLACEWPDEPVDLTDTVQTLEGIDYDLRPRPNDPDSAARVVGLDRHFTTDGWAVTIALGSCRKALHR